MGCKHSCIDYIFLKYNNYLNNKIEAGVIQINITNHFATIMAIEIKNKTDLPNNVYNKLNEILMKEVWIDVHNINELNKCYDAFIFKVITLNRAINTASTFKIANAKKKR